MRPSPTTGANATLQNQNQKVAELLPAKRLWLLSFKSTPLETCTSISGWSSTA